MSVEGEPADDLGLTGSPLPLGGLPRPSILTINGGSSSLRFAVFAVAGPIERLISGRVERVGLGESRLILSPGAGRRNEDCAAEAPDQAAAAGLVIERVEKIPGSSRSSPTPKGCPPNDFSAWSIRSPDSSGSAA